MAREVRGDDHPETLAYAINAAFDEQAAGAQANDQVQSVDLYVGRLKEILGSDHPDAIDAGRGERAECDIELPPT